MIVSESKQKKIIHMQLTVSVAIKTKLKIYLFKLYFHSSVRTNRAA